VICDWISNPYAASRAQLRRRESRAQASDQAVVIRNLAGLPPLRIDTGLFMPVWLEGDAIRRICHHKNRKLLVSQQLRSGSACHAVAAQ
jgi:hypothetical protein